MQLSAISHRPDSEDAFLYDKDHLRIRLHTAKNDIAKVTVFYNDPYMFMPDKEGQYIFHYHIKTVSYTHLTLPTTQQLCRSRWSPYH